MGSGLCCWHAGQVMKTRAAWFEPAHVIDLLQAARAGGFYMIEVGAAALCKMDPNVAAGQLMGAGLRYRPYRWCGGLRSTHCSLCRHCSNHPRQLASGAATLRRSAPASVQLPKQIIRVGSIVLASVTKEDGWWEAGSGGHSAGAMCSGCGGETSRGWTQFDKLGEAVTIAPSRVTH